MAKEQLVWHTEMRKVSELVPNDENPRIARPKLLEDLTESLKEYDLVEIPVADFDLKLLAGHQRLMILKLMGRGDEMIPVRMPNRKLTKSEYDRYLLISNRLHADFDWDKLVQNFGIETMMESGFDDSDFSQMFDNNLEVEDDSWNEEKELAKIKEPIIKPGEMYQLGAHRLICADSLDPKSIKKLAGDEKIDMVDVDPIFNINYSYASGIGAKNKYGGKATDNKSDEEYSLFLKTLIENSLAVCKKNAHLFWWCDQRYIGLLQQLYKTLGIDHKRVCLWIKNNQNPTPQIAFNKAYEACVYGTIGKPFLSQNVKNLNEILNKETGTGSRLLDDIMDLFDIWLVKRLPAASYEHPTEKSPTLHEKALKRCTKVGDNVLDICAGSGSIMIACEQLKRRAFMSEIDPIFATLIINRYEKLSNKKARKIS